MKTRLLTLLMLIFVVTIVLLVIFFRDAMKGTIAFEVAKSLLQLGVVAVVGTLVSMTMTEYQLEEIRRDKDRDRMQQEDSKVREIERLRYEYREELLLSTLSRTMAAYSSAKRARRLFRARAGAIPSGPGLVKSQDYDRFMETVNDVQLQFEGLKSDVKSSKQAFSIAADLESMYQTIESYFGCIVKEYEQSRHKLLDSESTIAVAQLKALSDFLGPTSDTNKFRLEVVDPYHTIQEAIRADLLYPKLPQ
jgi:hypothetical protein